jgi:hypothetical protein
MNARSKLWELKLFEPLFATGYASSIAAPIFRTGAEICRLHRDSLALLHCAGTDGCSSGSDAEHEGALEEIIMDSGG